MVCQTSWGTPDMWPSFFFFFPSLCTNATYFSSLPIFYWFVPLFVPMPQTFPPFHSIAISIFPLIFFLLFSFFLLTLLLLLLLQLHHINFFIPFCFKHILNPKNYFYNTFFLFKLLYFFKKIKIFIS